MPEEKARRVLVLKPDPLGIPRNPLAVYLLGLAFLSGLMTIAGFSTSGAVESALPVWATRVWGLFLVHGAGSTLTGMYWPGGVGTGLVLKRIGMFSLTIAAFCYSFILVFYFGVGGILTAGIVAGFGAACAVQFHVINERIRAIIRLTQ